MKYVVTVALAVVLAVSGALGLASNQDGTAVTDVPVVGTPDSALVGAQTGEDVDELVALLQARLRRLPTDFESWATLALAYVEQARISGDPGYYAKAEAAVERSRRSGPEENPSMHASAAALGAARHAFTTALDEANQALAIAPRHADALAVRVDALTELGRYRAQMRALKIADSRQPGVPVASRYAYALELRGRLGAASDLLERQLRSATTTDRAYLLTQIADLDRKRGRLVSARGNLARALAETPGYLPALASQARLAVAQGRLVVAERRWSQVVRRLPLMEHLIELGELRLHRRDLAGARARFDVVRSSVALQSSNGVGVDLEAAQFEADHGSPAVALRLARAEWRSRPSIHAADTLAWALHVNGRDQQALPFAVRATRLGTQDSRLWLHRGLIEASLNRKAAAVRHLRRSLTADPGFSPWQTSQATVALDRLLP